MGTVSKVIQLINDCVIIELAFRTTIRFVFYFAKRWQGGIRCRQCIICLLRLFFILKRSSLPLFDVLMQFLVLFFLLEHVLIEFAEKLIVGAFVEELV